MRLISALLAVAALAMAARAQDDDAGEVRTRRVAEGVWVHTTTIDAPGFGPVPCNGLVIEGPKGVIVVDTPATERDTLALLDWIEDTIDKPVRALIVSHAHNDAMGGLAVMQEAGALSIGHAKTRAFGEINGLGTLNQAFVQERQTLVIGGEQIELFHPGAGHTEDNIVVFHDRSGVLFGGCLIRAKDAPDLGNTQDAVIDAWASSARRVQETFPQAALVVPGHGAVGGLELLEHTAALAEAAAEL